MTLIDQKKLFLKIGFIAIILVVVFGYGYFKIRNLLLGPTISVSEPINGQIFASSTISIRGLAKNVSSLSLNDRPIFVNEKGDFSEIMALSPGYNIISLKGADKFGKKTEKTLELVLRQ
ncbi:MAG: hypothetical protein WC835_03585 [Candidatus Paceibacterota bacterium]|jgi:hypothetical protein